MKNTIKILNDNNINYDIKDNMIYLENEKLYLLNKKLLGVLDVSMVENLKYLNCSYNNITEIKLNDNLHHLRCEENNLSRIVCNKKLQYLDCDVNQILELKLNDKLETLRCSCNNLVEIKCNKNLKNLYCYNNPILKLNKNTFNSIWSDIYVFNNEYYIETIKIEKLKDFYFFKRFINDNSILYTYQNFTVSTKQRLYSLLNEKYY